MLILSSCLLLLIFFPTSVFSEDFKGVQIASNAGVLEEAPENTLVALELALKQGADILKVDVRRTKDGELILMREEIIDLVTNGKGEVGKLLSDELMLYDAGLWLHDSFEGEPVPLLREVLRFAKINGVKVILDVREQGLESQIISLLEELGMVKEVYLWGMLGNLREKEPSYVGPSLYFLSPEDLTPANIKHAHLQHKEVITSLLGYDNREEIRKVAAKGPDILLVDFPAVAADVLNKEGIKEPKGRTKRRALIVKPHGSPDASHEVEEEEPENRVHIDLLDPIGTLYNLLVGPSEKKEKEEQGESGLIPSSKEIRSLSRTLKEPGLKDKGFLGRGVRKVSKGLKEEEAEKSRMAALKMTTLYSEAVVPPLLRALSYKRPATRANAAWALGLLGDVGTAPTLLRYLWDEDIEVKREVAMALGRLKDPRAGEALQELLLKGAPVTGSQGATPAARYGTIPLAAYQDAPSVRYDAARALGYIRYAPASGDLLRTMIKDPDWRVKGACAWALGRIGDGSAAPALGKILMEGASDPFSSWAHTQAAWALSKLGEDSLAALLDALRDNEEVARRRACWALVRIGSPALPTLFRALRDPKPWTRWRAALALGWIGDSKAVSSLLRSVYDEELEVRQAVIWALGRIGDPRAKGLLDGLLKDDEDGKIKELAGEAILRISKK